MKSETSKFDTRKCFSRSALAMQNRRLVSRFWAKILREISSEALQALSRVKHPLSRDSSRNLSRCENMARRRGHVVRAGPSSHVPLLTFQLREPDVPTDYPNLAKITTSHESDYRNCFWEGRGLSLWRRVLVKGITWRTQPKRPLPVPPQSHDFFGRPSIFLSPREIPKHASLICK